MGFSQIPDAYSAHAGVRSSFSGVQVIRCYYTWYKISSRGGRVASPVMTKTWYFKCKGGSVTPTDNPVELHIIPETLELYTNETHQMDFWYASSTPVQLSWKSSDTSVANVDNTGLVTALNQGSCEITMSGGVSHASCQLQVSRNPSTYKNGERFRVKVSGDTEIEYQVVDVNKRTCEVYTIWNSTTGSVSIPDKVNGFRVIGLAKSAFSWTNYSSIILPDKLEYIGESAFYECHSLSSIKIPSTVRNIGKYAFAYCLALSTVTGMEGVQCIEQSAFANCLKLSSINFSTNLTTIEREAFNYCTNLKSISLPNSVTYIGTLAFSDSSISEIIGGENIENMYGAPFSYTPWDRSLPDGGNYIGKVLYKYKGSIPQGTALDIKEGTVGICSGAFANTGATHINIPQSMKNIYSGTVFSDCPNLKTIIVDSNNKYLDSRNNCNAIIDSYSQTLVAGCNSTIIPSSVKSIGYDAFYRTPITSIVIPEGVDSIASCAFESCKELKAIYVQTTTPYSIPKDAFLFSNVYTDAILFVPVGTKANYQATDGWKEFEHIEEMDFSDIIDIKTNQDSSKAIYSLDGQQRYKMEKGINIIGSRKVLIK